MSDLFIVCRTFEVDEELGSGFWLAKREPSGETKPWPLLILRKGNQFFGYENSCPHSGERLDAFPGEFMDEEANFVRCGRHGALFDVDTGHCFMGPCQGQSLTPIPLIIDDGDVCVSDVELADEDGLDLEDD